MNGVLLIVELRFCNVVVRIGQGYIRLMLNIEPGNMEGQSRYIIGIRIIIFRWQIDSVMKAPIHIKTIMQKNYLTSKNRYHQGPDVHIE